MRCKTDNAKTSDVLTPRLRTRADVCTVNISLRSVQEHTMCSQITNQFWLKVEKDMFCRASRSSQTAEADIIAADIANSDLDADINSLLIEPFANPDLSKAHATEALCTHISYCIYQGSSAREY